MTTIDIGIATANRPAIVAETVAFLAGQSCRPGRILVCPAAVGDFEYSPKQEAEAAPTVVFGGRGLTVQRNVILQHSDAEILIFLDDDFLPASDYILETQRLFASNPDIAVATGKLLADGARTGGMEFDDGRKVVDEARGTKPVGNLLPTYGAYGCNMAIRMSIVRQHNIRFDEALPLYGWQEDIDFSRQMAAFGRIVQSPRLRGVHLGTIRSGRSPGRQLGYSQVANPYYLVTKGTMSLSFAWRLVRNNLAGNLIKSLKPEPTIDRHGRLLGNLLAVRDILVGRCHPKRILELK